MRYLTGRMSSPLQKYNSKKMLGFGGSPSRLCSRQGVKAIGSAVLVALFLSLVVLIARQENAGKAHKSPRLEPAEQNWIIPEGSKLGVTTVTVPAVTAQDLVDMDNQELALRNIRKHVARHCAGYNGFKPQCKLYASSNDYDKKSTTASVVYTLTRFDALPMLRMSVCSLRTYSPSLPVSVALSANAFGEDFAEVVQILLSEVRVNVILFTEPDRGLFQVEDSDKKDRLGDDWIKLYLWALDEKFDRIIHLDPEVFVTADIGHLLALPFNHISPLDYSQPGLKGTNLAASSFFITRPCRGVFKHYLGLLYSNSWMKSLKVQEFLDWYFKYDRFLLPASYFYSGILQENNWIAVGNKTSSTTISSLPDREFNAQVTKLSSDALGSLSSRNSLATRVIPSHCVTLKST